MSQYWSDIIDKLTPYTPGEQPKVDGLVKLNTNENPYGPSPKVLDAIKAATLDSLRKYPDPKATALKQSIADYYRLDLNQVFVGNSSDEVLAHTFRGLLNRDKPLLFPDITYSFYPVYCSLYEIEYRQVPLADDFSIALEDYANNAGAIIFANPNAPTGIALKRAQIRELLESQPSTVVVVDEAYADFSTESAVSLIEQYPNLLITQTVSKSRSLAGLRVGLALAQPPLIEALERLKNSFHPYALDTLAVVGASAAFQDQDYFKECCQKIISTRQRFSSALQGLGFEVLESSANFVFATHSQYQASAIYQALRDNRFLVRHFEQARIKNFVRISIGTDQDMEALLGCLENILKSGQLA